MATATLTIDLDALADNWRALDSKTNCETAAVVKADGYGLGAGRVARRLANAGARRFFVAACEEAAALRDTLGPDPEINVFSGHMAGDTNIIHDLGLTPMINSIDQMLRHVESLPGHPFGVQLDSGMNRLGMEPAEWAELRAIAEQQNATLIMSHLACADEPDHPMNPQQLATFKAMTDGMSIPRSLSATGGILLGPEYHFDLTRPGIGLYGGAPFADAKPVAHVTIPVIQCREVEPGESVGYGNTWIAERHSRVATLAAGYADGLPRIMGESLSLYHQGIACHVIGRISMDMIAVDVTDLPVEPQSFEILDEHQTVDDLAALADTIGYEILTSMGHRYDRRYRA